MRLKHIAVGVTLLIIVSSGCVGIGGDSSPQNPATTTTLTPSETEKTTTATQSEERTCDSPPVAETKSLPEKPPQLNSSSVVSFAGSYQQTSVWNSIATNDSWDLSVSVENKTVVDETETGYNVGVSGKMHYNTCLNGEVVAGDGVHETTMFINNTTVIRR